MIIRSRVLGAVVAMTTCAVLSGCDPETRHDRSHAPDPPLTYPDEGAVWCLPAADYPQVALGAPLDFRGNESLTVESVRLVDPDGMKLTGAYVMPVREKYRVGAGPFPPVDEFPHEWKRAEPAEGATIDRSQPRDLVAHLSYTGPGGASVAGMKISYRQGDNRFVVDTHEAVELAAGRC